jgi:hypothetical protein
MSRNALLNLAFVLLLVALPLISFGTVAQEAAAWVAGVVVLAGGFLLPLALRFVPLASPPQEEPDVGEEPS